ncbi:MAG: hypothetical protein LBF22_06550 [Deltaproteobacteria bacterium]|jgi:hypothetical protein|nr:hypothetical protein [Deltaproteobacteria bacterium]
MEISSDIWSREFQTCWTLAANYIQRLGDNTLSWFKGNLYAPLFEHFSFRMGNQLFFVRLEDAEGRLNVPGNIDGLFEIAGACNGHPLLMPMKNTGGIWLPIVPGWGLVDAKTKEPVNPKNFLTGERVEYTDWELHDMAVHSVIMSLGTRKIHCFSNHPDLSPSIWYEGESGIEWIIVRWSRYPEADAGPPGNWAEIRESCFARGCGNGYFAVVIFAGKDPLTGKPVENLPLIRGGNIMINYQKFHKFLVPQGELTSCPNWHSTLDKSWDLKKS